MTKQVVNIRDEKKLRLLGRDHPSETVFRAHWTGSGVEMRIRCASLEIQMETAPSPQTLWAMALCDGMPFARFALEPGCRWYTVLSGFEATQEHTVSIVRETQPMGDGNPGSLTMHRLRFDGELLELPQTAMTIEFVGDSLTTGEGLVGPQGANEWRSVWFSSYSYSHLVCEALHARRRVVSQSGWGVYTSWDNDRNGAIPRIYDQVCAVGHVDDSPYDFASDPAGLVVINLGTNDGNALSQLKGAKIRAERRKQVEDAAVEMLAQVRRANPQAYILWVYGMCGHGMTTVLRRAVHRVRESGDKRVDYLSVPACRASDMGSRQHPGSRCHEATARAILNWIKEHIPVEKVQVQ